MALRSAIASLLILLPVLLAGCPRTYPAGLEPQSKVSGTHPWQAPGYEGPETQLTRPAPVNADAQPVQGGGVVEPPPLHGPALPSEDSLELPRLEGSWLVVAITADEKQYLLPVSEQDTFIFQSGGSLVYHSTKNWTDKAMQGRYRKMRPGVIGISFGGGTMADFYGQLFHDDFLYIWNYDNKTGFWMVRVPNLATERVEANTFDTTRGTMKFTDVVGASLSGKVVDGKHTMTVSGFYNRGILSLRWEEDDRTGTGWAAFVVGPEWKTLKGAWWIDDYEGAPFGDVWDGTKK